MTYLHTFLRDDGETEVTAEYSISGGHPGVVPSLNYPGDPPEAPEIELEKVFSESAQAIELTDVELNRLYDEICNNLPEEDFDYGYE